MGKRAADRFRRKLMLAMMAVVSGVAAATLYLAERSVTRDVERAALQEFKDELASRRYYQAMRHAALVERSRALVRRPRIHAALEDGALDLLYPSARDELRDLVESAVLPDAPEAPGLRARFYRFLDRTGAVIHPAGMKDVGELSRDEEGRLALNVAPDRQQIGYLLTKTRAGPGVLIEVIATPVVSRESGEVIAALVLGFMPAESSGASLAGGIKRGIWSDGHLDLPNIDAAALAGLEERMNGIMGGAVGAKNGRGEGREQAVNRVEMEVAGAAYLFFHEQLNPGSLFSPAYEVSLYPLAELRESRGRLRWQVMGAGGAVLLAGLAASRIFAGRLSVPVERLAQDSEENRAQRERAEAALESTSGELLRSARFSADASHQLKTPVTVLRAGLEELLARQHLGPAECNEISGLIHQTYRLASVIEDLLLLSRMDAGRLQLEISPVNLTHLIEGGLDDLGALSGAQRTEVETDFPEECFVAGEKRYTAIILQNLLENARKYNRPGGRIRIATRTEGESVFLMVGNTGRPISAAAREHIFERFHRGTVGENVPGHGLGLNLARELARIHKGDLRLVCSDADWTEFEVRFLRALPPAVV